MCFRVCEEDCKLLFDSAWEHATDFTDADSWTHKDETSSIFLAFNSLAVWNATSWTCLLLAAESGEEPLVDPRSGNEVSAKLLVGSWLQSEAWKQPVAHLPPVISGDVFLRLRVLAVVRLGGVFLTFHGCTSLFMLLGAYGP
jgi:hypothetical protein